ncbi:hypothetical protein LIA77_09824 [Sarocladium implicatum]|nr:hypothetical protein LIA77_09824 [Sarocladium implicatum]
MSSIKVLKTIPMGKGVTLEIKIDESEPEDSVKRYASEITSTGEEVVAVPPHWHKERPDPPGMYKAMFFNDLLSDGGFGGFWKSMRAFYDGDAYPAFPLYFQIFDEILLTFFGGIAHLFVASKPTEL